MEQQNLFPTPEKTFVLNEGQQGALDWLVRFCLGEDMGGFRMVLLNGYAGTGKTFTVNRVVEKVRKLNRRINFGMTAPTHKAVKVLKKTSELSDKLDFGTIHSFLALKEVIDEETGKVDYKPDFVPGGQPRRIDTIDVLIIDESSMLNDPLFEYILDELRSSFGLRVVFMGDEKQIPPVGKKEQTGEGHAIPFLPHRREIHKIHLLSLTEPQRQAADSPIIMYSVAIREQCAQQTIDFDFKEEFKDHLEFIRRGSDTKEYVRDLMAQYFDCPEFQADPDYAKIIAYTNKTVNAANTAIRLLINKVTELPKIIDDEKLIMDEPLISKEDKILIAKNMDVVAQSVQVTVRKFKYFLLPRTEQERRQLLIETQDDKIFKSVDLKVYSCVLVDEMRVPYPVDIIHEESEAELKRIRDQIRQQALKAFDKFEKKDMWKQFYGILKKFAWVKYNYAITAHKSQGSTYQYTFSMEWDMETDIDIEERNRIRYVAATRAKQKLWVIR